MNNNCLLALLAARMDRLEQLLVRVLEGDATSMIRQEIYSELHARGLYYCDDSLVTRAERIEETMAETEKE